MQLQLATVKRKSSIYTKETISVTSLATLTDAWDNPAPVWVTACQQTWHNFHLLLSQVAVLALEWVLEVFWQWRQPSWCKWDRKDTTEHHDCQFKLCIILHSPLSSILSHLRCFCLVYIYTALLLSFQNMYVVTTIMFYSYALTVQCTMLNYST